MTVNRLNPNHAVSQAMDGQWLKILAIYMHREGINEIVITEHDILSMSQDKALAIQELHDGMHIRVVELAEAVDLARKEGGLPS